MKLPDPPTLRVILCGDRDWSDWTAIVRVLRSLDPRTTMVITGGAPGADTLADKAAQSLGFGARVVEDAQWEKYGRAAGPIRNQKMLEILCAGSASDHRMVIAFHDDLARSKGTKDMVTRTKKRAKRNPELNIRIQRVGHVKR